MNADGERSLQQQIKLLLVTLAEYLQTSLTDPQVVLYAAELGDMTPEVLGRAISALKADPSVWSGRFPLPAKIRAYAYGDIDQTASEYLNLILRCSNHTELYNLPGVALAVAKSYGFTAIVERSAISAPTIYAQLRESLRSHLMRQTLKREPIGLPESAQAVIGQTPGAALPSVADGEPAFLPPEPGSDPQG